MFSTRICITRVSSCHFPGCLKLAPPKWSTSIATPGRAKGRTSLACIRSQKMAEAEVPPAVLPGTPARFPIAEDKLISLAQEVFKSNSGVDNPDLLSDDFRFEFPVVSLAKKVLGTGAHRLHHAIMHAATRRNVRGKAITCF